MKPMKKRVKGMKERVKAMEEDVIAMNECVQVMEDHKHNYSYSVEGEDDELQELCKKLLSDNAHTREAEAEMAHILNAMKRVSKPQHKVQIKGTFKFKFSTDKKIDH